MFGLAKGAVVWLVLGRKGKVSDDVAIASSPLRQSVEVSRPSAPLH